MTPGLNFGALECCLWVNVDKRRVMSELKALELLLRCRWAGCSTSVALAPLLLGSVLAAKTPFGCARFGALPGDFRSSAEVWQLGGLWCVWV